MDASRREKLHVVGHHKRFGATGVTNKTTTLIFGHRNIRCGVGEEKILEPQMFLFSPLSIEHEACRDLLGVSLVKTTNSM